MESLDELKADKTYKLTELQRRLFLVSGCDPACHACKKPILIGDKFKLLTYTSNLSHASTAQDEMCCADCGLPELKKRDNRLRRNAARSQKDYEKYRQAKIDSGGNGYSRPTRIEIAHKGEEG